jgi:hypothetical protein
VDDAAVLDAVHDDDLAGLRQPSSAATAMTAGCVTAAQLALAWNAMEIGLGLERLTQPQALDGVVARRLGWLLLDAALGTAQASAGNGPDAGSGDPMNGKVRYHRRRLADTAAGLRAARTQVGREHGPRAQLAAHQQQRLETVVRHAAAHSPFYRQWLAETGPLGDGPAELRRLPVLDKALLMEHFHELVCDRRLHRDQLLDRAGQLSRDRLYLDRYRVLLTSGSSGRPGLFVYDAAGWRSIITQMLRSSSWAGLRPSLPRQRVAWIGGAGPSHVTRQAAATLSIGVHRVLALPATLPLPELVEALDRFQGHHPGREPRLRRPFGAGRAVRGPAAGHQPAQPGPAAAPAGGDRPGHPRPRPPPVWAHPGPRPRHPRPQRRRIPLPRRQAQARHRRDPTTRPAHANAR